MKPSQASRGNLDWIEAFVRDELAPLDLVFRDPYDKGDQLAMAAIRPLQDEVKDTGLWACHLGPDLGGPGFGQVKLALMNELLGRSAWAPSVFGCQAPDSGNAEILAHYGTDAQKEKYLQPLLDGRIGSCYSMTEPHAGADPTLFTTRATREGVEWVIDGEKWFSSYARYASFLIVMAVTNPDVSAYKGMSMFIVPSDTPGVEIIRNVGIGTESEDISTHAYVRYTGVRIPADHLLGGEGQAFLIAQTRLGGGRIHHAIRTLSAIKYAFDMMCERAVSRQHRHALLDQYEARVSHDLRLLAAVLVLPFAVKLEDGFGGQLIIGAELLKEQKVSKGEPADAKAYGHSVNQRSVIRMSREEVSSFLASERKLTLCTTSRDGFVHAVPTFYEYMDGCIHIQTKGKSQKVMNLRREPQTTCLVECGELYEEFRGVMVSGRGRVVDDEAVLRELAERVLKRIHGDNTEELAPRVEMVMHKRVAIRIEPQKVVSWDHRKLGLVVGSTRAGT